ncbi:MAG: hypothetical protein HOK52_07565 [Candidatus Marinimicrobia bacterium]|nr:hypothetical protein [Candidatus Neomarinimicrobiota bacterium]MBT6471101.1 hypothetical protein [Candidatus Neomarinimicrobiota bacterium]
MKIHHNTIGFLLIFILIEFFIGCEQTQIHKISINIEKNDEDKPVFFGIPIPKGSLYSVDKVRVLNAHNEEIPSQITEVSSWEPLNQSIKWIWVFFFSDENNNYTVEYGENIVRKDYLGPKLRIENNMRNNGFSEIITGPLKFRINKNGNGFLDEVSLAPNSNGFSKQNIIATGPQYRGSFLDILDENGIDYSKSKIIKTELERGSGPLHMILRVDGEYYYSRPDNLSSPFTLRIHAYAGKSYLKVFHTITYTGKPDKHKPLGGEDALISLGEDSNVKDIKILSKDKGWKIPNDQISSTGLNLKYNLENIEKSYFTSYLPGNWYNNEIPKFIEGNLSGPVSIKQLGPNQDQLNKNVSSTPEKRMDKFFAKLELPDKADKISERASGWIRISDKKRAISVGIRHFMKEYPKEITVSPNNMELTAYNWSPNADPMHFARTDSHPDRGQVGNFATGITKTSELIFYFEKLNSGKKSNEIIQSFLYPNIPHAQADWYANSGVFGNISSNNKIFPEFQRALDYKYKWMRFNRDWEPWYGMFNYGDVKTYSYGNDWILWNNNEPGQDYIRWLQFMRTGNKEIYLAAESGSRHSMDVDNIHWPNNLDYIGDSNPSQDWWDYTKNQSSTPYLGMGAVESRQHWGTLYSAHVWTAGWLAHYYLSGYHRGLDIAKLTADTYLKRIWGEHGLTGRRLYLSIWNIAEVYDATKNYEYWEELQFRVDKLLKLQREQGGNFLSDRYGYAQAYITNGLRKVLQFEIRPDIEKAIIEHARWIRDVPPMNHTYESYLATISPLIYGYELSGEKSFYREAWKRAQYLKVDKLENENIFNEETTTQADLFKMLEKIDNMPPRLDGKKPNWVLNQGSRIFGWTHAYNLPYLLFILEKEGPPSN